MSGGVGMPRKTSDLKIFAFVCYCSKAEQFSHNLANNVTASKMEAAAFSILRGKVQEESARERTHSIGFFFDAGPKRGHTEGQVWHEKR